jgi:hypothetical protein
MGPRCWVHKRSRHSTLQFPPKHTRGIDRPMTGVVEGLDACRRVRTRPLQDTVSEKKTRGFFLGQSNPLRGTSSPVPERVHPPGIH